MNPLLEQFLIEARENLAFIEQNLQHLGSGDSELINAIFRAAHTMKGGSGIVGFEAIKSITHRAEDLLDMLRSGKIAFNERMVEVLFDAFDEVVDLVEAAEMSGDVVEADEAKVQAIIRAIDELMNKKEERPVWKLPFKLDREAAWLKGAPMSFLSAVTIDLPLSSGEITEENLNDERLYAILFDVAQDCMVYGNDPIYALSLLGEKLLGIDMAMGRDEAKAILSGFDDEEGLLLRSMIIGYARASWSEIEDALYNFIDDIVIAPLSLELLWPNEPSDANVELYRDMMEVVRDGVAHQDLQAVTESINHLLGLIEPQTATAVAAQRLLRLVEATQLRPIEAWQRHVGVHAVPTQPAPSTAEAACEPPREITESDRETIRVILKQQYEQLLESSDAALVARVAHICSLVASCGRLTPPPTTRQEMIAWIEQEMGMAPAQKSATKASETTVPSPTTAGLNQRADQVVRETHAPSAPPVQQGEAVEGKRDIIGKTIRVEQETVDKLMSLAGELLVAKNSLPYLAEEIVSMDGERAKKAILEKSFLIGRLSDQLQDLVMGMRMLPISYVFDRYPKLVRDISKKLGKKVHLEQEGAETKLDKNIIEMLADPLVHIVRNSLDHGIETPSERVAMGKKETGELIMRAFNQSDRVVIEIIDDGRGIDTSRVVRKVLEKGLMTLEQIEALSEEARVELVMLPGLSTAEQISEYSGRGVGMDVVKKSIESFGGTVRIESRVGIGTKITMTIPVSLAVTTLLHVSMRGVHYGFPMDFVKETVKIARDGIVTIHNRPAINIRGEVMPLLFVPSMLDIEGISEELPIVILNIKGNLVGMVVNQLLGQIDVVQKPLDGILSGHPLLSGTALLGNGQIILIVDPIRLFSIKEQIALKEVSL